MTTWLLSALVALVLAVAGVRIVRGLRRRAVARQHAHDVQVWEAAYAKHGGAVSTFTGYDQAKAVAGHARAQKHTATGQPLKSARQLQARARRATDRPGLVTIAARRRAGGDR